MRSQWQIDQGNKCSCKGSDDMCPCQNVDRSQPIEEDPFECVSTADLIAVGEKVLEMADRVKNVHKAVPGAQATWAFEDEDTRFNVTVTVAEPKP